MDDINKKIQSGVFWNFVNLILSRGTSIIFTLFLARLLVPEAFGLIAMMTIFFDLAKNIVNSGFQQALIRSPSVSKSDLSTAFISNVALSALTYLGLFLLAPIAANFYEQPELTDLIRVAGIVVFVNSLIIVQDALLRRQMRFRTLMNATVAGAVFSGAFAVYLAYWGFGVWSLVGQMVSERVITGAIIWFQNSWRPSWVFSSTSFWQLYRFGYKLLLESGLDVLYRNSFFIVIGKLFSAELVGIYFIASRMNDLLAPQIAMAIQQASFPALSTLQHQHVELKAKYRRIISLTMFVIAPLTAGVAVLAPLGFEVLLDQRWRSGSTFLQLFCMIGLLYPLHLMNINILNVMGRSDLVLGIGLIKKFVNVVILILAIPYGIYGILIGQILASVLALGPNTYYSAKLIGYGFKEQVSDATRSVPAALISGSIVMAAISIVPIDPLALLILGAILGILVYLAIASLLCREDFTLIKHQIFLLIGRN